MERKCEKRIIHFGSCSVLKYDKDKIRDFMDKTGAAVVTGYTKDVDWIESAAFEMTYLAL